MSRQPLVSVIMPAYNAAEYIGRSIESVLTQDFSDWELIIIDDCSSDDTAEVVEEYKKNDTRIILLKNKENMGVANSRNNGIKASKGEYIALLDSDDTWEPQKLSVQIQKALSVSNDVLIYASYDFIDEKDNSILKPYIVPNTSDFNKMLGENVIGCSSVLVSKQALDAVGGFPVNIYHEDYALWMLLLKKGDIKMCGIDQVLMHHRQLNTARSYSKKKAALNRWRVYRKVLGLNIFKSFAAFVKYATNGIRKYRQ